MSDNIRIACVGDTMPAGVLHYESGYNFVSEDLASLLQNADIRVATLETAVGDKPDFDEEKMKRDKDVIYTPTKDLFRLTRLGINVVSLANNHAWDLGFDGIKHCISELDKLGIKHCGAGSNLEEASAPAVIEVRGKTIAFIAYCDNKQGTCGYIPEATDSTPGINVMKEANIHDNISRLKGRYDYLFVLMHWGKEYYSYPMPEVNRLSRKMIDWGADGVIGSHSHQIQPTIKYRNKPIVFSLGNFFFPDRVITSPRSTYYPEEKPDFERMPTTLGYPMVDRPTYKIWKPNARNGQVVVLDIENGKVKIERTFTHIDEQSHIDCADYRPPMLFHLSHTLVNLPFYDQLFFIMRGIRGIRRKINREI